MERRSHPAAPGHTTCSAGARPVLLLTSGAHSLSCCAFNIATFRRLLAAGPALPSAPSLQLLAILSSSSRNVAQRPQCGDIKASRQGSGAASLAASSRCPSYR